MAVKVIDTSALAAVAFAELDKTFSKQVSPRRLSRSGFSAFERGGAGTVKFASAAEPRPQARKSRPEN